VGSIIISGGRFLESLSEIAGFKCGLTLGRDDLMKIFAADERLQSFLDIDDKRLMRLHSVEYEDAIEALLYRLGRLEHPHNHLPGIGLYHRFKGDPENWEKVQWILQRFNEWMNEEIETCIKEEKTTMDPTSFIRESFARYGELGLEISCLIIQQMDAYQARSAWGKIQNIEWADTIELRDLFESEGLSVLYGSFIDQRYIDYLNRNFDDIDRMHWRKFEQLTAEWFDREGYKVELGPGRGDDGVDVRAWLANAEERKAPSVITQCKRQKASVGKVVVKSLYADVIHENADSGLLVTSSRLSPGAEQTRQARAYPVDVADRATLRTWLEKMRVPGAGFVG
jgi:restriction system protein